MRKDLILLVLLILPTFAVLMQKGYFSMHDDLQSMRQYQLDKCFEDWQIPCRWVPDMGYGYGYPLFNYYPPFPYLLGKVYRTFGFAYIDVVKLVGITGFIATAVFMYMLGRDLWGRKGGLVSAAFYSYAPYHSVDYYVRGAVNEFWAMAFYPAAFYATRRLILSGEKKWITFTALSVAGIMLSHNPMLMIFAPLLFAWCLFWMVKYRNLKSLFTLSVSAIWALGLAAFFTLPVVAEAKFVSLWTLTAGYFNYLAHFLDWRQIFININWGYGSSIYGPEDTMSFALGHLHWIIPLIVAGLTIFSKKLRQHGPIIGMLLLFTASALFMTHFKATEIWKAIKPLEFLQFPWRFMTVAVFSSSLVIGAVGLVFNNFLLILSLVALVILNGNYFRPREWYPNMTDQEKFSGQQWQLLITSGIFDYLPKWVPQPPADKRGEDLNFVEGRGSFVRKEFRTNRQLYEVVVSEGPAIIELQTYYFPGWKVFVDGKLVEIDPTQDKILGRMRVGLDQGTRGVEAKFTDTPIRTIGNLLSLVSWVAIFGTILIWLKKLVLVRRRTLT